VHWKRLTDASVLKSDPQLTNAELLALIAEKKAAIVEAQKHFSPTAENLDMTYMLENPTFNTNDWTGWTREAISGGNVGVGEGCAEAWNNGSFDIYQIIEDVPVGIYKLTVQGFYPSYAYMNPNGAYFPNIFRDAVVAFNAGMYTKEVTFEVTTEGQDLRVGVKGASNQGGDSWFCFDNFKLFYSGLSGTTTGISTFNANTDSQQIYDLQGRRVNKPVKGLYIKNGAKYQAK
jgi:hypothetical protein